MANFTEQLVASCSLAHTAHLKLGGELEGAAAGGVYPPAATAAVTVAAVGIAAIAGAVPPQETLLLDEAYDRVHARRLKLLEVKRACGNSQVSGVSLEWCLTLQMACLDM